MLKDYWEGRELEAEFAALARAAGPDKGQTAPPAAGREEAEAPMPDLLALAKENPDLVGWLRIPGTTVDYPVMQTPERPNYYLNHSFSREESPYGVPYAAEACSITPPSDNITIYGHHMKNGAVFGALENYEEEAFYRAHQAIRFDTLEGPGHYEVIGVFKTAVYTESGFPYYRFVDAKGEEDFNTFLKKCEVLSLYTTGKTAQYGDKLLCLSTCEYSRENGRLVILAKRI